MKTPFRRMKRTMAAENDAARRSLHDLRVIDLRSALEKRSLDKSGVKSVLLQRLQKALEEDGVDPENFYSEVMKDSTPARKPKRTNKKLTRDDESETHSNVDDSLQNDLSLELDSDDERMDKGLEATDVVEDAINLSIEEEEKLLTEEDDGIAEREEKEEKAVEGKATAPAATKIDSAFGKPPVLVVTLSEQDSLELGPSSRTPTLFNGDKQRKSDEGHSGHCKDKSASSSKNNADSSQASETSDSGKDAAVAKGDKKSDNDPDGSSSTQKTPCEASKRTEKPCTGDTAPTDGGASHTGDGGDKSEKEPSPSVGNVKVDKKEEGHKEDAAAPSATAASGQSAKTNKSIATASRDAKGKVRGVRPKKPASAINSKNLWVSGLSSSTRATDLKNLFSKYGKVIGAKIVTNAHAPVSRYYGFVTMASSEEATKCIEHLHRIELHGRMISVEKAKKEPVSQQKAGAKTAVKKEIKTPSVKVATESAQQKETKVKESEAETVATDEPVANKDVKETEKHEEVAKKEDVTEKEDKEKAKEPKQEVEVSKEAKSAPKASSLSSKSRSKSRDGHGKEVQASSNFTYANVRRHTTYRGGYRLVRRAMITRRPFTYRPRNLLTFKKITAERIRQRQREEEREMREVERRRHQDFLRQKDIERKQREEAVRLERERERLRMEREKLEREKAEVLRHEREKQRMERERIEREREDLRRREFGGGGGRYDDTRRPFKRPMEPRGPRDEHWGNRNKRPNLGPNRFHVGGPPGGFHGNDRGGRPEPYERVKVERYDRRPMDEDRFHEPPTRRNDMGRRDPPMHHDRDERRIVLRTEGVRDVGRFVRGPPPISGGGSGCRDRDMPRDDRDRDRDRMGPPRGDIMHMRRPSPRTDWKQNSQDRPGGSRGHHNSPSNHDIGGRGDRDRYGDSSSKGMSGSSGYGGSSRSLGDNRYGGSDRGGDSWHSGGPSSSSDHRSGSKQYSSSASSGTILGGGPARESWGGDRKVESGQSWGRSESSQGDRWGSGGIGGGMETRSIRSTQSTSISQPVLPQTGSSMYGTTSGSDTGGMMMGMNSGGSSYTGGDRYDAYKGLSGMRRY